MWYKTKRPGHRLFCFVGITLYKEGIRPGKQLRKTLCKLYKISKIDVVIPTFISLYSYTHTYQTV